MTGSVSFANYQEIPNFATYMKPNMKTTVFSASMKLADLVEMDYGILNALSRMGIGLGFGENTISEMCESKGINIESFIMICKVYLWDDYMPSSERLSAGDVRDVVQYLHNSHAFYMQRELVDLEANIEKMTTGCDDMQKKLVSRFFNDYKSQLRLHFEYEEDVVFPYVMSLCKGEKTEGYSIEQFEQNHSNIDETLNDLKNIVMKYLPESCDTVLRNDVLHHLFELEEDLLKHTVIEDKILIPMVNRMEVK